MSKFLNWWLIACFFIPLLVLNFLVFGENHHVYLAHAFLKGSTSLVEVPKMIGDLSYFEGKYYWPLGPLPAVLLMPFVLFFGLNFQESFIKFPLTILNFWLVYKICQSLKVAQNKAILLALFFVLGSVYTPLAVIPFSVYLSQIVTTSAILLAIYEFFMKRRWLIIGLALGLAFLSRNNLILGCFFFTVILLKRHHNWINFIKFMTPLTTAVILMAGYNYHRFDNPLDFGLSYRVIPEETQKIKELGMFSLKNVPTNLFYLFLGSPEAVLENETHIFRPPYLKPNYWGMSIFLISPILFLLFKSNLKHKFVKLTFITILIMLIPIITYYGIGWRQIGYRYALDFMPFLLIPLASAAQRVSTKTTFILTFAGIFITWFFITEMLLGF